MISETSKRRVGEVVHLPPNRDPDSACTEMQAATFLGVSVRTLQGWRSRGGGPAFVRCGRLVRYQRRALIAFFNQNTVAPAQPSADNKAQMP
ncbi:MULTISPECIES: helix-turn-helix domain-containing protein [unclassified Bradyrhizobium]|uniref:helix-turn-helix domain-containing protein n=1 Tax=unclassified Bradyrhizobium TaxID=2631580 RepID=UPI0028F143A6|nr:MULTISPECIES: helix-turn-helix domain-containing protein [unclassified Bradyrhizobium]